MVLLEGQVAGVLEGEHHRPDQGDLGGARRRERQGSEVSGFRDSMKTCLYLSYR